MIRNSFKLIAILLLLSAWSHSQSKAFSAEDASSPQPRPSAVRSVKNDLSPALRDIKPVPPPPGIAIRDIPKHPLPVQRGSNIPLDQGPSEGPAIQSAVITLNMPSPIESFEGISNADNQAVVGLSVLPPDTNGDVGPDHYVQMLNIVFAVWDKSGTLLLGPLANNTLWSGFGGLCETTNRGDSIVLYDPLADRWLMSQFAFDVNMSGDPTGPYHQCIAISQSADPTGSWYRYDFLTHNTKMNDYPKFGVWPDGYYMSVNQFDEDTGFSFAGAGVAVFERDQMLLGNPAQMVYFDTADTSLGGMLPSDLDGSTPPPAGTPNYFLQVDDNNIGYPQDRLEIWEFHVDWDTLANSTFTGPTFLPTASFDSTLCGFSQDCIPQPGVPLSQRLDAISDRLMFRLAYRNFGTHESLVTNHTVDASGSDHAGIRWYELRNTGSGWSIQNQGTYAPDADHRWMGSIAMDQDGNIALGYSISSSTTFPSIRYTGRLTDDTPDTLPQGEAELIAGGGSQTDSSSRWGDYSMMSVDPTDDCTFWYTQEYYAVTSSRGWQTRIGSFKFPTCGAEADLAVTKSDAPDPVFVGEDLIYTVIITNNGPDDATGVTLTDTLPGDVAFVSANATQGTCNTAGSVVTCNLEALGTGADATVTITVTPTSDGIITNTASVSGNESDPDDSNNSDLAITTVNALADLSIQKSDSPGLVVAGNNLTYTVTVTNNGPSTATGVTMTDTLPAGVTFVSASASQGSCNEASGVVTCDLGDIGNGNSVVTQIVVVPQAAGTITNTAVVSATETDPDAANNSDSEDTSVTAISVSPASHFFGNVPVGTHSASRTFTVSNTGTSNLTIGTISLTGSHPSEFAILTDNCTGVVLAASDSCTVDAEFFPTSAGTKTANLTIPSDDPVMPVLNVPLSGTQIYILNVNKAGTGSGTVTSNPGGINCGSDCSETYNSGTGVSLTATPDTNSTFAGWSGDADCTDGSVTMNNSKSCTATFSLQTFTLTVTKIGPGSGTVASSPSGINCGSDCSAIYNSSTEVTLTPIPAGSSTFAGWSGNVDCNDGSVTMNADKTCTATFVSSGDLDGSGRVDGLDLGRLGLAFGSTPDDNNWDSDADLNGDGMVDGKDLTLLGENFGKTF
jgi:uncharacterized repeat protein (TIGR01451 family)